MPFGVYSNNVLITCWREQRIRGLDQTAMVGCFLVGSKFPNKSTLYINEKYLKIILSLNVNLVIFFISVPFY